MIIISLSHFLHIWNLDFSDVFLISLHYVLQHFILGCGLLVPTSKSRRIITVQKILGFWRHALHAPSQNSEMNAIIIKETLKRKQVYKSVEKTIYCSNGQYKLPFGTDK